MGGKAFLEDGLYTPRMPNDVYSHVLNKVEATLRQIFLQVDHAIEAPAKISHGDIDVFTADPIKKGFVSGDTIAKLLGAHTWKRTFGNHMIHVALPWPEEFAQAEVAPADTAEVGVEDVETNPISKNANSTEGKQKFIQVDIHTCSSIAAFQWLVFNHAHGDLWHILGSIIRRLGMTISPEGFAIRIAEVEAHNRSAARVKLSDDPTTILEFLGLDAERFWKPFSTYDEIMAYAATCRFHDPGRWKAKSLEEEKDAVLRNRKGRGDLTRPMFGYWIETYLPTHADDPAGRSAHFTRDEVVADASTIPDVGADFASRFTSTKDRWMLKLGQDNLWTELRKSLPVENCHVGYVMKGMKREIAADVITDPIPEEVHDIRAAYQQNDFETVLTWARANWKVVGDRQEALDRAKSSIKLKEKMEKEHKKQVVEITEGMKAL